MSSQVDFLKSMYVVVDSFVCRYTLPSRPTIYVTSSVKSKPDVFLMPVDKLAIVGTENSDGKFFHFRLSFYRESTKESVRIDMQPSYTDMSCPMRGVALIEYRKYPFSKKFGPEPFVKLLVAGETVGTLLNVIFNKHNMDQYIFNDEGQGCRHWCACVLEKLVEDQLVAHSVPQDFADYEIQEYAKFGSKFPLPRIKGNFYH
ncbi:hypothetical protein ACEPAH_9238 [Sanghuangporus vaninii]